LPNHPPHNPPVSPLFPVISARSLLVLLRSVIPFVFISLHYCPWLSYLDLLYPHAVSSASCQTPPVCECHRYGLGPGVITRPPAAQHLPFARPLLTDLVLLLLSKKTTPTTELDFVPCPPAAAVLAAQGIKPPPSVLARVSLWRLRVRSLRLDDRHERSAEASPPLFILNPPARTPSSRTISKSRWTFDDNAPAKATLKAAGHTSDHQIAAPGRRRAAAHEVERPASPFTRRRDILKKNPARSIASRSRSKPPGRSPSTCRSLRSGASSSTAASPGYDDQVRSALAQPCADDFALVLSEDGGARGDQRPAAVRVTTRPRSCPRGRNDRSTSSACRPSVLAAHPATRV